MKKVLKISDLKPNEEKEPKPIEFVEYLASKDWHKSNSTLRSSIFNVIHLGKDYDGFDLFAVVQKENNTAQIYRGHLNDGVY